MMKKFQEEMMKFEMGLPSVFWLVLILALIPAVQGILEQFFPATEYWYSALIVAILGAVAKAIQVTYGAAGNGAAGNGAAGDGAPPGAAGDVRPAARADNKLRRWLL
jgi:hypothetical protein